MASGYRIKWTNYALFELKGTIEYLEKNWTEKEIQFLASKIEHSIELLSKNPFLFQVSGTKKDIRRGLLSQNKVRSIIEL